MPAKKKKTTKVKAKPKTKPRKKSGKKASSSAGKQSDLRQSKTPDFVKRLKEDNSMVEYFTALRILNPAAQLMSSEEGTRREGAFVRLAHAKDEFTAPKIVNGKADYVARKEAKQKQKKRKFDEK